MRRFLALGITLVAVLACGFLLWVRRERAQAERIYCRGQLWSIGCMMELFEAPDGSPRFPTNMAELAAAVGMPVQWFTGRGPGVPANTIGNDDDTSDFIYVYWPDGPGTPRDYPVMYNRRLGDLGGGVYILQVAGIGGSKQTTPPPLWDDRGLWLKRFAEARPQLDIPLPEDMR